MGPGLISSIVWISGQFHLSIRQMQAFLKAQWHLDFSLGAISQAQGKANSWLSQLYWDIGDHVRRSEVAHADETSYYRGKERRCPFPPLLPAAQVLRAVAHRRESLM